jgi:hypothetical protein
VSRNFTHAVLLVALSITAHQAVFADEPNQQNQWVKFKKTESAIAKPLRNIPAAKFPAEPVQQGYFSVPAYFSPPQTYQRPTETFRATGSDFGANSIGVNAGLNAFKATLPMVAGGGAWGYPYRGYGYGYRGYGYGLGGYGGYGYSGLPFSGYGFGYGGVPFSGYGPGYAGLPFSGYGAGGWSAFTNPALGPLAPGLGFGGVPGYSPYGYGYGWYTNPGFGAIMMGAFGNSGMSSKLGAITPTRVIQSAPSKASGNYYAPSTADPTASGGYYATTTPAMTPMLPSPKQSGSYWGSGGDPFPKDLNSVPWNK